MLFAIVVIGVTVLLSITVRKIVFEGKWEWVIYFMALYLPFYTTSLSIVYQATGSPILVNVFKVLKEFVVFLGIISFIFYQKNIFDYPFRFHWVDKLFLMFYGLCLVFLILPIGEAGFISKLVYMKNILMMGLLYFFGRNTRFNPNEFRQFFNIIMGIAVAAFGLSILEKIMGLHFQQITGYADYNLAINDIEPSGNYGLSWTFETQTMGMRLASFFSTPLEMASACLLGFSVGLIGYLTSRREQSFIFILVMLAATGSLVFAASRSSFVSFFVMLFFIALIFRLYGLIKLGVSLLTIFVIYVVFIAPKEFYYFVIDTLTFQNSSSIGHVIAWLEAINQIIIAPWGTGLAMSGNMSSVTDELRIGGENQFLVFGVQLGVLGMILYILILGLGIKTAIKVFRRTKNTHAARIAFLAGTVKVGLLLPLFTSNAEIYAYVSWLTWWMIGFSVREYHQIQLAETDPPNSMVLQH
ncbi:O-antigen ligase family protein [Echinicola jeungdonensis]|uniref:O-antigen ligase family protein n=1 Tax=Echinicola jeungdonensis TaxID=709343 RepID=A0ABV5J6M7_9BACT|nr:O-antigen ligase family protein [Echinicola jeungdonensis]MDN3669270.1 O-antigen ligase family protein [Echinicola jeungdonensis]